MNDFRLEPNIDKSFQRGRTFAIQLANTCNLGDEELSYKLRKLEESLAYRILNQFGVIKKRIPLSTPGLTSCSSNKIYSMNKGVKDEENPDLDRPDFDEEIEERRMCIVVADIRIEGEIYILTYQRYSENYGMYPIDEKALQNERLKRTLEKTGVGKREIDEALMFARTMNAKGTTLNLVFEWIVKKQKEFLRSGKLSDIDFTTLSALARQLKAKPDLLSRVIENKVGYSSGRQFNLKDFFSYGKKKLVFEKLKDILNEREKKRNFCSTDNEIQAYFKKNYRLAVNRRTIAEYRGKIEKNKAIKQKARAENIKKEDNLTQDEILAEIKKSLLNRGQ